MNAEQKISILEFSRFLNYCRLETGVVGSVDNPMHNNNEVLVTVLNLSWRNGSLKRSKENSQYDDYDKTVTLHKEKGIENKISAINNYKEFSVDIQFEVTAWLS